MTILCSPSQPSDELIAALGAGVLPAPTLSRVRELLEQLPTERLVVVGPEVGLDEAAGFAIDLRLTRPLVGVVAIRPELDVEAYAYAMQAGIRELVAVADLPGLVEACQRSQRLSESILLPVEAAAGSEGKVITIFSSKGGCGKTTLATNLAATLHDKGARRVCLVDLDLAFGDVAISLQLEPRRTLVDAVAMGENMDATGVAGLLTTFRPGLECLLAPVEPGDAEKVPAAVIDDLLAVLRGMFDYVVVDTPPQFNEHVLRALDGSDHHVLLTNPDMAAVKNLRLTLDMLDLLSYPRATRSIILNREDDRVGITAGDVEQALRSQIAARIPNNLEVVAAFNRGVPIAAEKPSHRVSEAIRKFSAQCLDGSLAARTRAAKAQAPKKPRGRWLGVGARGVRNA
ncbi:CpaE family protein [Nocardioides sp. NPDC051685]|uniref:CpaE family protein n=1 Tax=Nocardioides sp. NPDC051685 TaxID=3364334 RepID=UPI0037BBDA61